MESNIHARVDFRLLSVYFTLYVYLNTFTVLGSIRCEREQSSLINQRTVLDCTITGRYYGVYWYIGDSRDSIIRYINGHKAGSEYQSGKLDIASNGSMIIKNTGVEDEKTYRVMVVWSEGGDDSAYVDLTVIVYLTTPTPSTSSSIESKSRNTQSTVSRTRNTLSRKIPIIRPSSTEESGKDRTNETSPHLLAVIILLAVFILILLILYKDRVCLCKVLKSVKKKRLKNENDVNELNECKAEVPSSLPLA